MMPPKEQASKFKLGTIKKGQDRKMYKVVKEWVPVSRGARTITSSTQPDDVLRNISGHFERRIVTEGRVDDLTAKDNGLKELTKELEHYQTRRPLLQERIDHFSDAILSNNYNSPQHATAMLREHCRLLGEMDRSKKNVHDLKEAIAERKQMIHNVSANTPRGRHDPNLPPVVLPPRFFDIQ